jgi:hypothetical protein
LLVGTVIAVIRKGVRDCSVIAPKIVTSGRVVDLLGLPATRLGVLASHQEPVTDEPVQPP